MVSRLTKYAIVKILTAIPILFVILLLFFLITHVVPGDPAVWLAGEYATAKDIEKIRHEMGLDRPLNVQLVDYLFSLLRGQFGRSYASQRPVMLEISEAYPATIELALGGTFFAFLFGLPVGILGALKKDAILDHLLRFCSISFVSIPVFWLGILFQMLLGISLGLFPLSSRTAVNVDIQKVTGMVVLDSIVTLNLRGLVSSLRHLFMPTLTLGLMMFPGIARVSRANMISELSEDYIATAKAKGCTKSVIVYKHALRNAVIPVVTMLGMSLVGLMGGAILVETVFSLPGLGRLLVTAAYSRDYPLLQACIIVIALVILIGNTVVDIVYAKLDPRVTF